MDGQISLSVIRRYVLDLAQKRPTLFTPGVDLARAFQAALFQCPIISFDIFDTLLVRHVHHPRDVFLHLERTHVFRACGRWPAPVWQSRIQAENQARQQLHRATGSGEATLAEIYGAFAKITECGIPVAKLVRAEEEIELKLCRPCMPIRALYLTALAAGKRIIFVSDTYHHADFLCELLSANGFPAARENMFASSDLRLNKQRGQLFPVVLQRLGVPASAVLHLGDHPISDFQQPRAVGMQAILHAHHASAKQPRKSLAPATAPLQTVLCGLAAIESRCHNPPRDFWWLLGYRVLGPLLTGFCLWLERCFRSDGITRAWFLLRDGEIFERVYKALFPLPRVIPVATLPSSRRAFLLPVLELAPNLALTGLLSGFEQRPVREYLERLQLPADAFADECRVSGFPDPDEKIEGHLEGERLFRLIRQPRVQAAMIERARLEKELLLAFLRQEGLTRGGKIGIVDLGWRGSIHKAMHHLLAPESPDTKLAGYYLATTPGLADDMPPGLFARSFLMHQGKPEEVAERIAHFPQLLEIACSGAGGSLLFFRRAQERIEPVFQKPDASTEQARQIALVHDGAVAFAHAFNNARTELGLGDEIPPAIAAEELFRLIASPTKEEAVRLGPLTLSDNAGSTTFRACAQFREASDPQALFEDYRRAFWKPGLIAQPSPQAAALRTLLWLMQE